MKLALLIVDMQKAFLEEGLHESGADKACEYINHVAGLLRSKGHSVIHVCDLDGQKEPQDRLGVIPEVLIDETDKTVWKQHSNGFWETSLGDLLKKECVEFIIVAGFAAEECVTFTFNGAREHGFQTAILQHGIASFKPQAILDVYRDRPLISYRVIEAMLGVGA